MYCYLFTFSSEFVLSRLPKTELVKAPNELQQEIAHVGLYGIFCAVRVRKQIIKG